MICLKISTFVVSTTTIRTYCCTHISCDLLENIYLCGINNNNASYNAEIRSVVICLKISTFVVSTTTPNLCSQAHLSCDLLENIYLCGINNNGVPFNISPDVVVICLKISTFVVSTTTCCWPTPTICSCDLLENIYLCGINNNSKPLRGRLAGVVICLKISTFVVSTTTSDYCPSSTNGCDLLENIYLCGINNNGKSVKLVTYVVVICLKISTFVVSTTTVVFIHALARLLWFAWKYLPLWYQQQRMLLPVMQMFCCDLLENIYLCGINNNKTKKKQHID